MIPAGCVAECPACKHRDWTREESSAQKQGWVEHALRPYQDSIQPIIGPEARWHYRRKVVLHARPGDTGWAFGLLQKSRWEEKFIELRDCPVQSAEVNRILAASRALPLSLPLAYVQVSGAILTLVLKSHRNSGQAEALLDAEPMLRLAGVESLYLNWNPAAGRRVLSSRHMEKIFGPAHLFSGELRYGPLAFRQQIQSLELSAQALAESFFRQGSTENVLDLYSGLGATLARWRGNGWKAVGVELVGEACELAALNAPGSTIFRGRVEERLPQLEEFRRLPFALFTNPPRGGQGERVNAWVLGSKAERIAYLSCSMRSFRGDLDALSANFRVCSIQPFDFFPQTDHVEAIALLERI